jgi:hypothetical protein
MHHELLVSIRGAGAKQFKDLKAAHATCLSMRNGAGIAFCHAWDERFDKGGFNDG